MLVLSRKSHEEIVVGNDIHIQVLEIRGGRVKLGFTAPADVRICRTEIHHALDESEELLMACSGVSHEADWSPVI